MRWYFSVVSVLSVVPLLGGVIRAAQPHLPRLDPRHARRLSLAPPRARARPARAVAAGHARRAAAAAARRRALRQRRARHAAGRWAYAAAQRTPVLPQAAAVVLARHGGDGAARRE